MSKFMYLINGECLDEDEVFDTYEEAEEAAIESISNIRQGAEDFYLSNPGDYPNDDDDDYDYDVVEVD